jgi:hypothetical protein
MMVLFLCKAHLFILKKLVDRNNSSNTRCWSSQFAHHLKTFYDSVGLKKSGWGLSSTPKQPKIHQLMSSVGRIFRRYWIVKAGMYFGYFAENILLIPLRVSNKMLISLVSLLGISSSSLAPINGITSPLYQRLSIVSDLCIILVFKMTIYLM